MLTLLSQWGEKKEIEISSDNKLGENKNFEEKKIEKKKEEIEETKDNEQKDKKKIIRLKKEKKKNIEDDGEETGSKIGSKEVQINFLRLLKKCEKLAKTWQPDESSSKSVINGISTQDPDRVYRLWKFLQVLQEELESIGETFPEKQREEYEGKISFLQDIAQQECKALVKEKQDYLFP